MRKKKASKDIIKNPKYLSQEAYDQLESDIEQYLDEEIEKKRDKIISEFKNARKLGINIAILENAVSCKSLNYLRAHYAMDDPRWLCIS